MEKVAKGGQVTKKTFRIVCPIVWIGVVLGCLAVWFWFISKVLR